MLWALTIQYSIGLLTFWLVDPRPWKWVTLFQRFGWSREVLSKVEGSGLGPLFVLITDKKNKSMVSYQSASADDLALVVTQHTDCSIDAELQNIANWSVLNKQNINTNKTKEINFLKRAADYPKPQNNVPVIPQIERVQQVMAARVFCFCPIYHSLSISSIFWLLPHRDLFLFFIFELYCVTLIFEIQWYHTVL